MKLRIATLAKAAALTAAAASLAGCISLLPKAPPVQLYEFGNSALPSAPAAAPSANPVGIALGVVTLPQATVGDQILTMTGDQVAYIKGARWASPATVLFQEDAARVFYRQARNVRLLQRSEIGAARAILRLDVHQFEVRYENGPGATPVVAVSVRATLSRLGGDIIAEQAFDVRQPAADNRVGPIVAAFDQASTQALQQIAAWTDGLAPSIPPREAVAAQPTVTTTTRSTSTTTRPRG